MESKICPNCGAKFMGKQKCCSLDCAFAWESPPTKLILTDSGHLEAAQALLRTFCTGATRSPLGDKLEYSGYMHPKVVKRFAQYMKKHQTQSDGTQREARNWQKGIPRTSLMDSGMRHFMDWWLYQEGSPDEMSEGIEESLCALMFNTMAYLKSVLDEQS